MRMIWPCCFLIELLLFSEVETRRAAMVGSQWWGSEAMNYTSESRRSYQFRHVGQCRALFAQRSARSQCTLDAAISSGNFDVQISSLPALLLKPSFEFGAAPAKPHIPSQPDAGNPLLSWCAGAGVVPNPRFGDSPTSCEFYRINQFGGVSANSGHQWDI
jgi:hypothetical protein